ncbi:hypothetical protein [Pasteurella multocida]|nr:hypothetical protein [Pasteurella multocida]
MKPAKTKIRNIFTPMTHWLKLNFLDKEFDIILPIIPPTPNPDNI